VCYLLIGIVWLSSVEYTTLNSVITGSERQVNDDRNLIFDEFLNLTLLHLKEYFNQKQRFTYPHPQVCLFLHQNRFWEISPECVPSEWELKPLKINKGVEFSFIGESNIIVYGLLVWPEVMQCNFVDFSTCFLTLSVVYVNNQCLLTFICQQKSTGWCKMPQIVNYRLILPHFCILPTDSQFNRGLLKE